MKPEWDQDFRFDYQFPGNIGESGMCNILQNHGVAIGIAQTVKCETLQDRQPYFFNRISMKERETEKKL